MKKSALIFFLTIFSCMQVYAGVEVFSENGKFGLKDGSRIVAKAEYKKLVRLGSAAWIMQERTKFGIIDNNGKILEKPKYSKAERVLGKYVKFSKGDKYGIFDEMGFEILPVEYSSIDLLYGGMFVTCKNYKYGITDLNGMIILDNIFDDIYMPDFNTLVIVYNGQTIEIHKKQNENIQIPFDVQTIQNDLDSVSLTEFTSNPLAATGYYGITATDYVLKIISSISPAYEQTIDELMYSNGADTVSVITHFSWIPKFPFVYARRYYKTLIAPNNGPLSKIKINLKQKANE